MTVMAVMFPVVIACGVSAGSSAFDFITFQIHHRWVPILSPFVRRRAALFYE